MGQQGDPGPVGYRGPKGLPGKNSSCLIGRPGKKGKPGEPGNNGAKGDIGPPGPPGKEGIRKTLKNATRLQDLQKYITELKADFYQCCFGIKARSHIKRAIEDINISTDDDTDGSDSVVSDTSYSDVMTTNDNSMLDGKRTAPCQYYVNYDGGNTCNYYFKYCPFKKGLTGYPGPQGPRGDPGKQGYAGSKGNDGRDGKPGFQGPKGKIGLPGVKGPPGDDVYLRCPTQGSKGEKGARGEKGNQGSRGITGRRGPRGNACAPSNGPDGAPGIPGYPGIPGNKGQQGRQGPRGQRGDQAIGDITEAELTSYKYQLKKLADIISSGKCCYNPKY